MGSGDHSHEADVLVIGAGIAGSAVAMHLAEWGVGDVLVVDPDLAGVLSSSERNAGGVRATWWQPENVALCMRTIRHFAAERDRVGFRQEGYLWLHDEVTWPGAAAAAAMQNALGCDIELLAPGEIGRAAPWLEVTDEVLGATRSPQDGLVNPDMVRALYRERARASGARFADRIMVTGLGPCTRSTVPAVAATRLAGSGDHETALSGASPAGEAITLRAPVVVNAAGAWAGRVASGLGYRSAAYPCPREISVFATPADLVGRGMLVDTTGCYVHHESGDLVLAGWSPADHTPRISFAHEGRSFFEREIWPRLARRIPAIEQAEYVRGWVGLYDLSPDRSAICGAVANRPGLYEIHSFSGRGVMQGYAMAELLAERIATGRAPDLLDAFTGARFGGAEMTEPLHI
jgi:glycine/D-amino acid oxidase-like deaminating enzyme